MPELKREHEDADIKEEEDFEIVPDYVPLVERSICKPSTAEDGTLSEVKSELQQVQFNLELGIPRLRGWTPMV